jgi:Domain of unknown function (DUF4586)
VPSSSSKHYFNPFAGLPKSDGSIYFVTVAPNEPEKKEGEFKPTEPFKPTSKCGFTINPYPSYEPPKVTDSKVVKPNADGARHLIFKPSGVTGSYPIRSIIESSVPLAPPLWLQQSLKSSVLASQ